MNNVTLFHGGGGFVSTTLDYLKFCQMILNKGKLNNNQILKEETVDLILQDHLEEVRSFQSELKVRKGEAGFGLAFAIRGNDENTLEKVYGWGGLVGTYFKIDLEHDLAYVLMIQLYPHGHLNLREKLQNYIESAIVK